MPAPQQHSVASTAAAAAEDALALPPRAISVRLRAGLRADDPEAVRRLAGLLEILCRHRRADEAAGHRYLDEQGGVLPPL